MMKYFLFLLKMKSNYRKIITNTKRKGRILYNWSFHGHIYCINNPIHYLGYFNFYGDQISILKNFESVIDFVYDTI